MAEKKSLILYGKWCSPYARRVELALKVKGIDYEYVEENLKYKSSELLRFNHVHKKVPVLVHNGKPISESMIILEYIDETWKLVGPRLLPEDPYERANIRFWANFLHHQVFEALYSVLKTEGEEQERAIKDVDEKLKVLEEGMKNCCFPPHLLKTINGESMRFLDIVMWSIFFSQQASEEIVGVKMLDPDKYPLIWSWFCELNELPIVKQMTPPHEKLVVALQKLRKIYL